MALLNRTSTSQVARPVRRARCAARPVAAPVHSLWQQKLNRIQRELQRPHAATAVLSCCCCRRACALARVCAALLLLPRVCAALLLLALPLLPCRAHVVTRAEAGSTPLMGGSPLGARKQSQDRSPRPENVEGSFYVDHTCIDCDT